jgi:signal transduction histidine kinase
MLALIFFHATIMICAQGKGDTIAQSLRHRILTAKTAKEKISANYAMANHLNETDSTAAEVYYKNAYDLAVLYKNVDGQAKYFYFKSTKFYNKGFFSECEYFSRKALEILDASKDTVLKLHVIGMLFNAMEYQAKDILNEKKLLDFFDQTAYLDASDKPSPNVARGFIYACLSWHYIQKDDQKSKEAFLKQYECYRKVGNDELLMSYHINYAHFNLYIRNFNEASRQTRIAVDICRKLGNKNEMDFMLSSISLATMLIYEGKFSEARRIYNNVVTVSTRMRQDLLESEAKSHQLELANAKVESDKKVMLILVVSSLLLMSLLYILLRWFYRLKALRAEIKLKENIAMDLHDEVGTMITKTIFLTQNILNSNPSSDPRLQQIVEQSRQVNASFRDAIWSTDTRTDELQNLIDRIAETGNQMTEGTPYGFYFHRHEKLPKRQLKPMEKRNVMLIVREALLNAVKHSQGNRIDVSILLQDDKLIFTIIDNGNVMTNDENRYGMGQHSMRQRALKMGADIYIGPAPDGYMVRLVV